MKKENMVKVGTTVVKIAEGLSISAAGGTIGRVVMRSVTFASPVGKVAFIAGNTMICLAAESVIDSKIDAIGAKMIDKIKNKEIETDEEKQ